MLSRNYFMNIAPIVRDMYRKHIFSKALDVHGAPFKSYTTQYGERKRGNKFKRQSTEYKNSRAPVLTGDLYGDFKVLKIMNNGFQLGWAAFGSRVIHLGKMGRVLSADNQVFPDKVERFIDKATSRRVRKKLPKNKTIRFKI